MGMASRTGVKTVQILFLPKEFGEMLHLKWKPSFDRYAQMVREGGFVVYRVELADFTEDDVLVTVSDEMLVILGNRYPGSFCIQLKIPPDAVAERAAVRMIDQTLEITMPVQQNLRR